MDLRPSSKKKNQRKNKHAHTRIRVRSSTFFHFYFCSRSVYLYASQLDGGTTGAAIFFEGAASGEMCAVLEREKNLKSQCPSTIIKKLNVEVSFENLACLESLYLEAVACVKRRLCVRERERVCVCE